MTSVLATTAQLAWRSAMSRRFGVTVVMLSIALSTFLLLGLERIRQDVKQQFSQSVSGTDLIVGPRTGSVQLLLYSVFRIGNATQNMRWRSAQDIAADPAVAWTIPLSLGDTHRSFPVVGTTQAFFTHFQYGEAQALAFAQGRGFDQPFEAVIGAEVAQQLGYRLGDRITLSHGDGEFSEHDHDEQPFEVVGILKRTGTPVDRSVHIPLQGMEAIHLDYVAGVRLPAKKDKHHHHHSQHKPHSHASSAAKDAQQDLTPRTITALLVGLKSRTAVLGLQRQIADYRAEPLMAVMPGVALDELWQAVRVSEQVLWLVSTLVAAVSLASLVAVVVTGLEQRRRELAILRSLGASPWRIFSLLVLEGGGMTLAGALLGWLLWTLSVLLLAPWLQAQHGLQLTWQMGAAEWLLLGAITVAGCIASLLPGWRAYRLSLADGLHPR